MSADEQPHRGFSCPGIFWLPGVVAFGSLHVGVLLGFLLLAREKGLSWSLVALACGLLAVFWIVFVLVGRWIGTNGAFNLLGLLGALVTPVVGFALLAWWLWG